MRRNIYLLASLAALALTGVWGAPSVDAQRREDQILAELRQIQAQLGQLQTSQAALKKTVEELVGRSGEEDGSLRKNLAESRLALERLQEDVSILAARMDETNGRLANLRQEIASMRQTQQPLVLPPSGEDEAEAAAASEESGEREQESPAMVTSGPSVTDVYNQARIDYMQGRYALAISGFQEVLDLAPRGDLADNARYWTGESYLAQRQYERALEEFDRIIREYPDSNKLADAYLKKAMTLQDMGKRSEAMTMYELVIDNFPRTPQQRVARRKLEELMRTTPPRR